MFIEGIHLVTKFKKSMTNRLMLLQDSISLRKRALEESVNDELKSLYQIEHSRHRAFDNFIAKLTSGLIAYCFLPKKVFLNLEIIDDKRITKVA